MTDGQNNLDLPIGFAVPNWTPPPRPARTPMFGTFCRVEPLAVDLHASDLYRANAADTEGRLWTYLPYGPFDRLDSYANWMRGVCDRDDPLFYAIVDSATDTAVGVASYLRIAPEYGTIEVGHINYSPALQRTPAATEAMYLMMKQAFELGYRRYEWKCNALNAKSRAAAQRLGFSFEGVWRQAAVIKGCNRDTAWYAAIDLEWPLLQAAFERWLDPTNFDERGQQRLALSALTGPILQQRG
ncbi:MAG: GNAT family N-acetyltransferase [Cyanosarcina radialis HA8281-LM2]|jgi:RimJ/RimL family protein N-acetyltransferase|nr:GNAT family N-acetyltransferase [Cyanosarcina radialis HA8281-LM2]